MPLMKDNFFEQGSDSPPISPGYVYLYHGSGVNWAVFHSDLYEANKAAYKFFFPNKYELVCILEPGDGLLTNASG